VNPSQPKPNGVVHVLCKTPQGVPASAVKAKTSGLFLNAQEAVPIITALEEMGHKQPPTGAPLETDNSTAHDTLKAQVQMKRSKGCAVSLAQSVTQRDSSTCTAGLPASSTELTTSGSITLGPIIASCNIAVFSALRLTR
jgi:hypothetical protein